MPVTCFVLPGCHTSMMRRACSAGFAKRRGSSCCSRRAAQSTSAGGPSLRRATSKESRISISLSVHIRTLEPSAVALVCQTVQLGTFDGRHAECLPERDHLAVGFAEALGDVQRLLE